MNNAPPYPVVGGGGGVHPQLGINPDPMTLANPLTKVELKISCRNLTNKDVFSKSDPFCVVYIQNNGKWIEFERTDTIQDNLNPDFAKPIYLDYYFEERQMLKFEVYDEDEKSQDLKKHDFIGEIFISLGSIIGENGGQIERPLQHDKDKRPGTILLRAEEVSSNKDVMVLQLYGKKLDRMDFFGKSDPFLVFERCNEDNSFTKVYETEVIKNTLNPEWKKFTVPVQQLCNGDNHRTIRVKCYDWERSGSHRVIGQFNTSVDDLKQAKQRGKHFELMLPDKKKKKHGTIHIKELNIIEKASFIDFIRGGIELSFIVAIDFTASNGNPRSPLSLHHSTQHVPSQYVQALQAVGNVIEDYDTDKLFPAFGFGAKLPPTNTIFHDFALNFRPNNPNCQGISGIVGAYYNAVNSVELYGPTNFAPIINNSSKFARDSCRSGSVSQYFILLIITDGIITDMERTKEAIVEAASLPMSIIIVGVGNAEFDAMEELDGDDVRVSYNGKYAERDIVQFVPFRDYMTNAQYDAMHGVRLARDVLHELPGQLVDYMEKRNIKPNPPPPPYYP